LFEPFGIHFDPTLRDEVVARVDALHLPSYTAIVMPRLTLATGMGRSWMSTFPIPATWKTQMLEFSAFARLRETPRPGRPPSADAFATPAASR
jgi:dipeptidyl-peptidase-3